ncbi:mRNA splicing protein, partial [Coemansia aciculifera]
MSSISQFLPQPKHTTSRPETTTAVVSTLTTVASNDIPQYGQRAGWQPKTASDFGGGGAYPEIHVLQYPLGMGRKGASKGNALSKQVDGSGN